MSFGEELKSAITTFKALQYLLSKIPWPKVKNRVIEPTRIEKLSDDIFSKRINFGSVITVRGKLTRYSTTYRPITYVPQISTQTINKGDAPYIDPSKKGIIRPFNLTITPKLFQFPVQALPSIKTEADDEPISIGFLYPTEFNGFILEQDKRKNWITGPDGLLIEAKHRPIPILMSEDNLENFSESEVVVTAVVSKIPNEVFDLITRYLCSTRTEFYYHFIRLDSSTRVGFCLDCRDKQFSDLNMKQRLDRLPAAIYIEGHFSGITTDEYRDEFSRSVPKGEHHPIFSGICPGVDYYLTEDEDVSLVAKNHSIFGFYTESDLLNPRQFQNKLDSFKKFYTEFRKASANNVRQKYSFEAKFSPDFIFDYRKQRLFHPKGVLSSHEALRTIRNHKDLAGTVDWLRNP